MSTTTVEPPSPAEVLAALDPEVRRQRLAGFTDDELATLRASWSFWARPTQHEPEGNWRWWAIKAGRGWGKNRTGSEWVSDRAERFAARRAHHLIGIANATYSDVRALQLGGVSGLRAVAGRRGHRVDIGTTSVEGRLRVWDEGWQDSIIEVHTADEPDRARGRNFSTVWCDEASKWKQKVDAEGGTAFTNIDLSLRSPCPPGLFPRGIVTMTPRAIKLVRDLVAGEYGDTHITNGSMYANRANLDPSFIRAVIRRYAGTRLGAQEIDGVLLDKVEGALWDGGDIEATRVKAPGLEPDDVVAALSRLGIDLVSIVVGVDPPGGLRTECGIVVAGWARGPDGPHLYVLDDVSLPGAPEVWAPKVIEVYWAWGADKIVGEKNYGGEMVRDVVVVRDSTVNMGLVNATRGKEVRAEPIAALWNQGRGHMVGGVFGELEGELTTWVPGDALSPNRLDAMVWCGHALLGKGLQGVGAVIHVPRDLAAPVTAGSPGRSTGQGPSTSTHPLLR